MLINVSISQRDCISESRMDGDDRACTEETAVHSLKVRVYKSAYADSMTWLVSMYESMYETLSSFHLYIRNHTFKLFMNINIGYAVIFSYHDFHLAGQTKVAYIKYAVNHHLSSISPDPYFET